MRRSGRVTPGMLYVPSNRSLPTQLPVLAYPGHFAVRRVAGNGCIKWQNRCVTVSTVLARENIGLEEIDDGVWAVHFGPVRLRHPRRAHGRLRRRATFTGGARRLPPARAEGP